MRSCKKQKRKEIRSLYTKFLAALEREEAAADSAAYYGRILEEFNIAVYDPPDWLTKKK